MLEEPSSAEVPAEVPTTLPEFVDAEGRRWRLRWTIGLARAVREKLSLDFLNAHNGKAVAEIAHHTEQLVNVLWELCARQAEQAEIDVESFVAALDGDALGRASDAILESLVLFSQPADRPAMQAIVQRTREVQARQAALVVEKVQGAKADELIERALGKLGKTIDERLARTEIETFGTPSKIMPASSGSTRKR